MRPACLLLTALLLAGCGSSSSTTATAGPVPVLPGEVPSGGSGAGEPVFGRAYLLLGRSALEVHSNLNSAPPRRGVPRGSRYADFVVPLPATGPRCISRDPVRDRLYIGCEGTLLVYSEASRLTAASQPSAMLPLSLTPVSSSYDETRDILYLGSPAGAVGRLLQAGEATNTSRVVFEPLTASGNPVQTLTGLVVDPPTDQLLVGATTRPALPTTLFRYSTASTTCVFRGQSTPVLDSIGPKLELEHERLLVLEVDPQGGRQLLGYRDYSGPPVVQGDAGAFHYDPVSDFLLAASPFVEIYLQFSKLEGQLTGDDASATHLIPSGDVVDIEYDPFR